MAGTALKIELIPEAYRIGVFNSAPGGFMVFGFLAALMQGLKIRAAEKQNKPAPVCDEPSCASCASACGVKPAAAPAGENASSQAASVPAKEGE